MAHGVLKRINQLNQRVSQLYETWRIQTAIPLPCGYYALARQYVGKDHPDFAAALNNLAVLYDRIGNYPQRNGSIGGHSRSSAPRWRNPSGRGCHPHNLAVLYKAMATMSGQKSLYQQSSGNRARCSRR